MDNNIEIRPITQENIRACAKLQVAEAQKQYNILRQTLLPLLGYMSILTIHLMRSVMEVLSLVFVQSNTFWPMTRKINIGFQDL
ncbi:hypothetical protein [Jeotgalibacillus soli]|uniref:hypothetical protein n=1 Tax=Jeotgalibacillus soli TaxID=889306 RepID=UPI00059799D7|nr:hypothetical protein [Jeotgalibacillus soli]